MCTIECVSVKEKWTPSKYGPVDMADVCRYIIMISFIPALNICSCNEVSATSYEAAKNLHSIHILQLFILICSQLCILCITNAELHFEVVNADC